MSEPDDCYICKEPILAGEGSVLVHTKNSNRPSVILHTDAHQGRSTSCYEEFWQGLLDGSRLQ